MKVRGVVEKVICVQTFRELYIDFYPASSWAAGYGLKKNILRIYCIAIGNDDEYNTAFVSAESKATGLVL